MNSLSQIALLIMSLIPIGAFAQKDNIPPETANQKLDGLAGSSAHNLMNNSQVASQITKLLGKKLLPYASGKANSTAADIFDEWMGNPEQIKNIDSKYLFAEGCRPQSCPEKAFLITDYSGKVLVIGILHHFPNGKKFSHDPILQLYSFNKSIQNLPKSVLNRIEEWKNGIQKQWQEDAKKWGPSYIAKILGPKWN